MKLTVIASQAASSIHPVEGWLVRLVGMSLPGDSSPPDLSALADDAAKEVRETFPNWLWSWCREQSALKLQTWPGPISWWWYTPLSEKSPLRSPLIQELYWLTFIKLLITRLPVETVNWYGNDPLIAHAIQQTVQAHNIPIVLHISARAWNRRPIFWWLRRIRFSWNQGIRWAALKLLGYGRSLIKNISDTAFFTLFPTLWEFKGADQGTAFMFGSWPQFLAKEGRSCFFPVLYQGSFRSLFFAKKMILRRCIQNKIIFLESLVSGLDWLRSHFTLGFWVRYFSWSFFRRRKPVLYNEVDVSHLLWRELDANVASPEIPADLMLSTAFYKLASIRGSLRRVFHHFEYQPMERAVTSGVRRAGRVQVIGVQAGIFTSNQMGFSFPADEAQIEPSHGDCAPVPDYLAAYGELPYTIFSRRLTPQRVCWSGPIRYPVFSKPDFDHSHFQKTNALPEEAVYLTVTTSISRGESLALLEAAFQTAAQRPEIYLLIKFHYHQLLQKETELIAKSYNVSRYQIFDKDLLALLQMAPIMLCAGSSTAMEAIQMGCMPLVYRPIGEMPCNPMLDVPGSVFFWNTSQELQDALRSCMAKDEQYQDRCHQWPHALNAQMSPNDGSANSRFYEFLQTQKVFA